MKKIKSDSLFYVWLPRLVDIAALAVAIVALWYSYEQGAQQDIQHKQNVQSLEEIKVGIENQIDTLGLVTSTAASQLKEQRKQNEQFSMLLKRLNSAFHKPILKFVGLPNINILGGEAVSPVLSPPVLDSLYKLPDSILNVPRYNIPLTSENLFVKAECKITNIGNDVCRYVFFTTADSQTYKPIIRQWVTNNSFDRRKYKDITISHLNDLSDIFPGDTVELHYHFPLSYCIGDSVILHFIVVYEGIDKTLYDTYLWTLSLINDLGGVNVKDYRKIELLVKPFSEKFPIIAKAIEWHEYDDKSRKKIMSALKSKWTQ